MQEEKSKIFVEIQSVKLIAKDFFAVFYLIILYLKQKKGL